MGPFTIPPFVNRIGISPLSTRPKCESMERRIILDLSFLPGHSVNDGINKDFYCGTPIKLTYPTIDTLAKRIWELGPCLIWKKDLQRYFRQIPLCPLDYSLIGMRWKNLLYFDKFMLVGLRSAAYVAQRISSAIVHVHRNMGHWSTNYIDDFGGCDKPETAWHSFNAMDRLLKNLGVQESKEKMVRPCTRMEFLGNTVDTENRTIEVSKERKNELQAELKETMALTHITTRQQQSIIGKLSFVTNCVRAGRVFLNRMLEKLRGIEGNIKIEITEEMKKDMEWWISYLPQYNGISIIWLCDKWEQGRVLATDASLTGAGGTCCNEYFHHKFTDVTLEQTNHIAQLEILAIVIALKLWRRFITKKLVQIESDNESTVWAVNLGKSRDKYMLKCIREIAWVTANCQCMVKLVHV